MDIELLTQLLEQQQQIIDLLNTVTMYLKYCGYAAVLYFFVVTVKSIYYLFGKVFFGGI
ncbi:hypothetical protein JCM19376_14440 [Fusibacter bizertensis]